MKLNLPVLLATFLFAFPASAHDLEGHSRNFSEVKKSRLKRIDKVRSCMSRSKNFKELRSCTPKRAKKKNK